MNVRHLSLRVGPQHHCGTEDHRRVGDGLPFGRDLDAPIRASEDDGADVFAVIRLDEYDLAAGCFRDEIDRKTLHVEAEASVRARRRGRQRLPGEVAFD